MSHFHQSLGLLEMNSIEENQHSSSHYIDPQNIISLQQRNSSSSQTNGALADDERQDILHEDDTRMLFSSETTTYTNNRIQDEDNASWKKTIEDFYGKVQL